MVTVEPKSSNTPFGYAGKILRVDLSKSEIKSEPLDCSTLRQYVGGAALGIKYLYNEVPPGQDWSDPANRLFLGTGPLGGTRVAGSGGIALVTQGALTNGVASTQANGFFGAFLRFCGFDAIIIQGAASKLSYLYIHGDGTVEIKDAAHLAGKRTHDTARLIREEFQKKETEMSVLSIGPAGENLVRFAGVIIDVGHAAAHNGVGAVMGSKKLKAIAVERGKNAILFKDSEEFSRAAKELTNSTYNGPYGRAILAEGTCGPNVGPAVKTGGLPVRNYTTSIHVIDDAKLDAYSPKNMRQNFGAKPHPCWACVAKHCHMLQVPEGKYSGRIIEEPEGEGISLFSPNVGVTDITTTLVLNDEVDALGFDINESGWVMSWTIECFEKRLLTTKDTDGLEMTWGNGEAMITMLNKIARREGFGEVLAEGVMRAARKVGGQAQNLAIHTMKGNTPRGHDHRYMWAEMFDTCVSNLGTLEIKSVASFKLLGIPEVWDRFDPEAVSTFEAKMKGVMVFEDSMYVCHFNTAGALDLLVKVVNAATGWDMSVEEALNVGRRAVNLARAFNLRQGIGAELDAPSVRYGSTPLDGARSGQGIMCHWDKMLRNYYNLMGWDEKTGKPLPETLKKLGLDFVIPQLWPEPVA